MVTVTSFLGVTVVFYNELIKLEIRIFREMNLSPYLFWDVDPEKLDFEKHARLIVERVVTRGRIEDWQEIKRYYGLERIKAEVVKIR
ncbi:MAG: hypothetical protein AAF570_26200, partial [Bacteroidota bacterium]